jgi:hypothetical protein
MGLGMNHGTDAARKHLHDVLHTHDSPIGRCYRCVRGHRIAIFFLLGFLAGISVTIAVSTLAEGLLR